MTKMDQQVETEKKSILDIPKGWGDTPEEFKKQVVCLIKQCHLGAGTPKYDILHSDGSITPFYPVLCAISPEWEVITREEIYDVLYEKFKERVRGAYVSVTRGYVDHVWNNEYLAWGLERKIFSHEELEKIPFNQGETIETYICEYQDPNLLESVMNDAMEKLLNPSFPVPTIREKIIEIIDEHCCY
ncbi:TPA: hypothetical protein DCZ36_00565 [Candidatus Gracilibacteria bacterium]|nr:hypothetical protein [Candidatus Gracilibacteria bacterium]